MKRFGHWTWWPSNRKGSILELNGVLPPRRTGKMSEYFPFGFAYEFRKVCALAFPIMMTGFVEYLFAPVSLGFCGQFGETYLAAAGLSLSIFHVAGVSIMMGLLTASETLFAQTFGGEDAFRLGIQVQRASVILSFCCIPCWAIHVIIEPILLASGQPPLICKLVGQYMIGYMPGLYFLAAFEVLSKYVQSQNLVFPPLIGGILGNIANAAAHYVLMYHTDIGIVGSSLAQSLGYMTQTIYLFGYIAFTGFYRSTWDAVHVELWHDWGIWFRLGIPGMMMSGMEWWVCESGSLVAGMLGEIELGAQAILNNIESVMFCLCPLGLGLATTIRIGQFLGANQKDGPKATSLVALGSAIVIASLGVVVLTATRYHTPKIFSSNKEVIKLTGDSFFGVIVYQWFAAVVGVCCGIIRGVGMQKVGAIVCCTCMYGIGGPIGLSLMLFTDMSIQGFWIGLDIAIVLEFVIYLIICTRIDWAEQCTKAAERTVIRFRSVNELDRRKSDASNEAEGRSVSICPARLICSRSIFLGCLCAMLVGSLCCRFFIDFSQYFQSYCILRNKTALNIPRRSERALNVADYLWLAADCIAIVP